MKKPRRPRLAVTLGDPAGIGPEVTLKALAFRKPLNAEVLLLGPSDLYVKLAKKLRLRLKFCDADAPVPGAIPCDGVALPAKFPIGRENAGLARAAVHSIELAARLALRGEVDGIVTAPINKAAVNRAGFRIPGHTEFLAQLSNVKKYEMMLVGGPLRVVVVTRHVALKRVSSLLSIGRVEEAIVQTAVSLRDWFGIRHPKIVVCGLNPHAGEKGLMGSEERRVIAPAVRNAQRRVDAEITGPFSPDALFVDAYAGKYDAEICMYHDQGLIPLKMISRGAGVNVTLGLPFVRTSPDHGTAYDIAGKGTADAGSMRAALETAVEICVNRRAYEPRR